MIKGLTILQGHVLDRLREMPDESVQTVITSPPYWGLRDYSIPSSVWGGAPDCQHEFAIAKIKTEKGKGNWSQAVNGRGENQEGGASAKREPIRGIVVSGRCEHCGAWRGCLGLEPTPAMFIEHMVAVFAEVHRVLRDDGTLWLNMGDSYSSNAGGYSGGAGSRGKSSSPRIGKGTMGAVVQDRDRITNTGMRAKNLVGIPWRLAFALQDAGWNLRSDIIWHKPNPMPESVRDRPTKAHEYIFLLSKGRKYYYDYKAIRDPVSGGAHGRGNGVNPKANIPQGWASSEKYEGQCATMPVRYPGNGVGFGHGTDKERRGRSRVKTEGANSRMKVTRDVEHAARPKQNASFSAAVTQLVDERNKRSVWTVATFPYSGAHYATFPPELIRPCILAGAPKGGVVLDIFAGSGTTNMVALQEGRETIAIEMSPANVELIKQRCTPSELDRQRMMYEDQLHQMAELPLFRTEKAT